MESTAKTSRATIAFWVTLGAQTSLTLSIVWLNETRKGTVSPAYIISLVLSFTLLAIAYRAIRTVERQSAELALQRTALTRIAIREQRLLDEQWDIILNPNGGAVVKYPGRAIPDLPLTLNRHDFNLYASGSNWPVTAQDLRPAG